MAETQHISAWIALFTGLYALAAAVGELREPGSWAKMLDEFVASPALRLVTGLMCIFGGAAIYLVNPWIPADWLAIVVSVLGGWIVAEGLLIIAAGDRFLGFARKLIAKGGTAWAGFSALFGAVFIIAALSRLQNI